MRPTITATTMITTITKNTPTRSLPSKVSPGSCLILPLRVIRLQRTRAVREPSLQLVWGTNRVGSRSCWFARVVYSRGYRGRLSTEVRRVDPKTIVVMEGDQTGQELLEEALRVLDPAVTGLDVEFARYDLSLENRRATDNGVVHEAAAAMRETGFGIKAATITPEEPGDVGSPNAILRKGID